MSGSDPKAEIISKIDYCKVYKGDYFLIIHWVNYFQPTHFCNLPHEKVYGYVFIILNILTIAPVMADYVNQYVFLQGKKF